MAGAREAADCRRDGSGKKWRKSGRWGWGRSFPDKSSRIFSSSGTRSAQGPHKVIIGQLVTETNLVKIMSVTCLHFQHNILQVPCLESISLLQDRFLYYRLNFFTTESISLLTESISLAQSRFLYYRVDFFTTEPMVDLCYRVDCSTTESISLLQTRFLYT